MPEERDFILSLRGLKAWFDVRAGLFKRVVGHVKAVDGVDLDVVRGEVLGLGHGGVALFSWQICTSLRDSVRSSI